MKKQINIIDREANKTKYKFLLNDLLIESKNYLKVRVTYNNGLVFKVYPITNTELNKYLIRL